MLDVTQDGSGRNTTQRLVAGFLQPEGDELCGGERCLSSPASVVPPERLRMAMIFQSYVLWPHMLCRTSLRSPV